MSQIPFIAAQTASATGNLVTQNYQYVVITAPDLTAASDPPTILQTETATTGGTLLDATTYGYKITIVTPAGETTASAEATQLTGSGGDLNVIVISFAVPAPGTSVNIYGRTSGGPWGLIGNTTTGNFTDDGSVTPGAAPPGGNTTTESVTVNIWVPDGQTPPTALDVNGNAASFATPGDMQVFFGGPTYQITKSGTVVATGVYVDFGGRVT